MLGTFGGGLDTRKINAKEGRLSCDFIRWSERKA